MPTRRTARCGSRATDYGDDKDRVMVRENGAKTYFASDIAYHLEQARARLRACCIYIWGADHHGYIARVRAGLHGARRTAASTSKCA